MTIGERIKERREMLGMSQDELAKRLGYKSRSSINKIELGLYNLKQSKIKAIADALDTTPSYIMGWDEEKEAQAQACELFEQCYGSEVFQTVSLFLELDPADRAAVTGYIHGLLNNEKYSTQEESKNA